MNTLAHWNDGGGPGPWILFFPLVWVLVIGGVLYVLRRTVWRGGRGGRGAPFGPAGWQGGPRTAPPEDTALGLLDRRFASGEIDEDEYWRRFSVLNESGNDRKDGGS